jgi:cytidylate kinase
MPIITFNGPIGAGGNEIGQMVANTLNIDYVDRAILAEAAKLVKSPVGTLVEKEQRLVRFRERLVRFMQTMLERSAVSGASGEPYFGRGIEMLPAETYPELAGDPSSTAQALNDKAYIEATSAVVKDLARAGNVVIIGRGANMILGDAPGVIHVGVLAPKEVRVRTIIQREHLDRPQAEAYVEEVEQARVTFFRKFFKVHPDDPNLYHVMLNMSKMQVKTAAEIVVHAAGDLTR